MIDGGGAPPSPAPRGSALGLRLALAFLGVALAAIAVLAGLTAALAAADVSALAARQRAELTSAIAVAAAAAWGRSDSWDSADLSPALDLAARTGADAQIRNQAGRAVASSPGFTGQTSAPRYRAAVMVRGERAGQAVVQFTGSGLGSADHALQTALLRAIAGAAGLAALLALLAGLAVARRITGPVERIIAITRAMGRGERSARVGTVAAPGELRELATAFDQMADTLDRHEQLRRDLVADVAHELRTPVAVLQAGHEAPLDGVTEPTPDQLVSLRDEAVRLARMLSGLHTLADAAALHLALEPCDLAGIAATAADSLAGQFDTAGLAVERRLEAADIRGDPRWLHQVLTNLLTNALKSTAAGGRVTSRAGPARSEAVLTVTDTAPGSPPVSCRASSTGSGAAGRRRRHPAAASASRSPPSWPGARRQLTASSQPGRGTRMTLTLPRA